ncbi:MAG: hypothetical protein QM479_06840 [Pseudomonadota bacterium]
MYTSIIKIGLIGNNEKVERLRSIREKLKTVYLPIIIQNIKTQQPFVLIPDTIITYSKKSDILILKSYVTDDGTIAEKIQSQLAQSIILEHKRIIDELKNSLALSIQSQELNLKKISSTSQKKLHLLKAESLIEINTQKITKIKQDINNIPEKLQENNSYKIMLLGELKKLISRKKEITLEFKNSLEKKAIKINLLKLKIEKLKLQLGNVQHTSFFLKPQESHKHRMNSQLILFSSFIFGIFLGFIIVFSVEFYEKKI